MEHCARGFADSQAEMLCCVGGVGGYPMRVYGRHGFRQVYEGRGMLSIVKGGTFADREATAYASDNIAGIRQGSIGDQFDCDKFLEYSADVHLSRRHIRRGPAALIPDFRTAVQEQLSGHGQTFVAENGNGAVVAYAFAVNLYGTGIIDFTCHSKYTDWMPELFRAAAAADIGVVPTLYASSDDSEKIHIANEAGVKVGVC